MNGPGRWPIVLAVVLVTAGAGIGGASQASDSVAVLGGGGAAGGLVGLAGSLLLDRARGRRTGRGAARERRDEALDPVLPETPPEGGPAEEPRPDVPELLSGESCPAPFRGRRRERDRIVDWCMSPGDSLFVLTGPAGVGKTRLVRYVASRLGPEWVTGWVREGAGGGVVAAALEAGDPALLLVDDADTRPDLPELLRSLTPWRTADRGVRVLLVARDRASLRLAVGLAERDLPGFDRAPGLALGSFGGDDDRRRWYAEAATAYAARLGLTAPASPSPSVVPGGGPDQPLLLLQAQALLAVLDEGARTRPTALSLRKVLSALLGHEAVRWSESAARPRWGVPGLTEATAAEVMAALTLLGADDEDAATAVIHRVPAFHPDPASGVTADAERARNVARWACALYGAPEAPWTVRIRPDLLADWLVIERLKTSAAFARNMLADLDAHQAVRSMATLIRAACTFPEAVDWLGDVLRADAPNRLADAVTVVLHSGPSARSLDTALAAAIDATTLEPGYLAELLEAIPRYELRRTQAALLTQQVTRLRGDGLSPALARALNRLGNVLRGLGRLEAARQQLAEAVAIYRGLVERNPDAHRKDLAAALVNLGNTLHELGCLEEARQPGVEAVAIFRGLVERNPDAHREGLAAALGNLGNTLRWLGQLEEARQHQVEAVGIYRGLVERDPDAYRDELANTLSNLGATLSELGQLEESRRQLAEAVGIRRELVEQNPDADRDGLAGALTNLGMTLRELGRLEEACQPHVEAIGIYRELVERNPDAHRRDLAAALGSLGTTLRGLGRLEEARRHHVETVGICRSLVEQNPDAYRVGLAGALTNLGNTLGGLGRLEEARRHHVEAVGIFRELVERNPDAHRNDLAAALDNLGNTLGGLGRLEEARRHHMEAVGIYRELVEQNPDAYRYGLAVVLANLGGALDQLGRLEEARRHYVETAGIYRELAEEQPGVFRQRYMDYRGWLRRWLSERYDEAEAINFDLPLRPGPGEMSPTEDVE